MALRYEEVTSEVTKLLHKVLADHFGELKNAKIVALFDLKKRMSGGQIVLGRIVKTNHLIRHLTKEEAGSAEGYDYIITIDKKGWEALADKDKVRLLRHELRHTYYDIDSEDNPYKLIDHTVNDFYEEIELNKDDPKWRQKAATMVTDMYEQEKEEAREKRAKQKKGKNRAARNA
ncbi:MAG TPA: putative metallopeptidase [Syntrophorhabdales bacterium]|nr:putative metallopeptidase [Syntrophorhabdales bacterium]